MVTPYIGEIRMFGGNFAPVGWALCDGSLLSTQQNDALFSLLGTIYGGDGRTTFGLPDLRGRVPMHYGEGPGLTNRPIGTKSGVETVTLTASNIPNHTHVWQASSNSATDTVPTGKVLATAPDAHPIYAEDASGTSSMSSSVIASSGGSASSVNNLMSFQVINFIIALTGIYPTQT
ncbi:phage tail protein [Leptolyngbyaceae cyanobacterium CCMR0082]|uniref:Phage tail protein n=2 Tax=Adonisia turfae TaxID=2950184 RepID=A0A6M0SA87_9CYAN|nr:tail fiber protein [Adonisia turfae]MDV3348307.1 tail fiber protein [Leptothoe sp. LEGE 181152]NEZ56956.1 phage tail protein [Adonisia turfae CCMR0081]NEZ65394.1 phage tail protein [Adonisia turfae CCMR0082]